MASLADVKRISRQVARKAAASKQDRVQDGGLAVAQVGGLQAALDGKQATIADGSLSIAKTVGLQSTLDGKQNAITSSNRLNADRIATGIVSSSEFNQLHNINTVSIPNGGVGTVQDQLDAKQNILTYTKNSDVREDGLDIVCPNICYVGRANTRALNANIGGTGATIGYIPDLFAPVGTNTMGRVIDNSLFYIVRDTSKSGFAQGDINGDFGIQILSAGLYRAGYGITFKNESYNGKVMFSTHPRNS
jgi:hypothetical protein